MDSWQPPAVRRLPGKGQPLRLYNTATQAVGDAMPNDRTGTMYVCGITPYDATHLGHAATMITFDLIHRIWLDNDVDVNYVQNVTDVDDPLFERAERDGEDWKVLGMRETALFREDMEALSIIPPRSYVGAVESIPDIVALIEKLRDDGYSYQLNDGTGDIYFPVGSRPEFGSESNYNRDTMLKFFAERGGDPERSGKQDPLDALLWRGQRDGEPSWESGMGPGRPGWHVECAAIALKYLGEQIDIQGGGSDLVFPHHEMSAAHVQAATGIVPFASSYVHAGMIGLDGDKMSKSQGNLVFVSRLRADGVDPAAIRLGLLDAYYRDDRQWTDAVLDSAIERLARWRQAAAANEGVEADAVLTQVRDALSQDLDTPAALSVVDQWASDTLAGKGSDRNAPLLVERIVTDLLGVAL